MKHVQLPNDMTTDANLTPQDLLIYVAIKRYMNKDTKEAFPSLQTICAKSGASVNTVRKCIANLEREKYFTITKEGRKNIYTFSDYKKFEPFSYDFLDKEDLTFTEKAYIIASQQYMYKDEQGFGKITLSGQDLSKKINMPESTISKCNKSLTAKDYLSIIKCNKRDQETGVVIQEKIFHLDELGQAVIWALHNHEERISNNEKTLDLALNEIAKLRAELSELKGQKLQTINI
jgi:DNA-binding transcriptional regulator YhcF (GntR family)